ncbi:MAG TPA: SpoIIE family protein phosphatase [Pyrinomonadaceae bacterium]|nr:SpoIIE family protein phosphatase [Pyrinomonadaceae bacterium]
MLKRLIHNLFPDHQLSPRARTACLLLVVLSPLAYAASLEFIAVKDPNTEVGFEINRREALEIASRYAATVGVNTEGWASGCKAEISNDRHFYFSQRAGRETETIRRAAPEAFVRVMFVAPEGKENIEVLLAPDGAVLGFERRPQANTEVNDPGEEAARALAESTFRNSELKDVAAQLDAPVLKEDRDFGGVKRRYSWRYRLTNLPELDLRIFVTTLGGAVTARGIETKFDDAYARRNFINREVVGKIGIGLYYFLVFVAGCYGFYRYVQRARQKEVPHARSLLLCAVVASAFLFIALQTDFAVFSTAQAGGNAPTILYWIIVITTAMFFLMFGLVFGLAYGSGEGDVRESYPGKLTSLDAIITGKIFSRNVARAVCVGLALGGWARLSRPLALLPWTNRPDAGQGIAEHFYGVLFGGFTWSLPLLNPLLAGMMMAVIGILFPLSLVYRLRSKKLSLAILIVLSFLSSLIIFQEQPLPLAAGLLIAAVRMGIMLFAFFAFDFLTAVIALAAPTLVTYSTYLVTQPVPSFRYAGFTALGLVSTFLALQIYFLFRGREYRDEEVRPLYARHLAERLGLQAEVSAAREAQIRLMPQRLPVIPGLVIAASCHPSRVVGGDFYDLFTLERERLGVFVAEGGGRGLGAALTIAYAKGFLMPRILGTDSPAEIVCSLQTQLAPMADKDEEMSFAYAVIDASARTLSYARTGRYPQVLITRAGSGGDGFNGHHQLSGEEVEAQISSEISSEAEGGEVRVVREATLPLAGGDAVTFYTDGISTRLTIESQTTTQWVSSIVSKSDHNSSESLQEALDKSLRRKAHRRKRIALDDDLTTVVVRLEPTPKV